MYQVLLFLFFLYSCNADYFDTAWELEPLDQYTSAAYFRIKIDGVYKDSGTLAVLSLDGGVSGLTNESLVHYEFQRDDGNGDWDVFYPGTTGSHDGQVFTLQYKETDDSDAIQLIPTYYIFQDNDDGVYEYVTASASCSMTLTNTGFHSQLTNPFSEAECQTYYENNKADFAKCALHDGHFCPDDLPIQPHATGWDLPRGCIMNIKNDGSVYEMYFNYLVFDEDGTFHADGAPEVGKCGMFDGVYTVSCLTTQCGGLPPCSVFNSPVSEDCKCYDTDITTGEYCHGDFNSSYALCTNTDGTESLSPCVCFNQVEVDSTNTYCHGSFVSPYTFCPNQNGTQVIESTCYCNGEQQNDGYCYGTFWSLSPICGINVALPDSCYCNGYEIDGGYCQEDHTTTLPYCQMGAVSTERCFCVFNNAAACEINQLCTTDTQKCLYPSCPGGQISNICDCNGETCHVGNRCIASSCEDTCPNDVMITLPCMCNGIEQTSGICTETGHVPACSGTLPCACGDVEITDGFCHDDVYSQLDKCVANIILGAECHCSENNECTQDQICATGLCINDAICDTVVEYQCTCAAITYGGNDKYDPTMTSTECEDYATENQLTFNLYTPPVCSDPNYDNEEDCITQAEWYLDGKWKCKAGEESNGNNIFLNGQRAASEALCEAPAGQWGQPSTFTTAESRPAGCSRARTETGPDVYEIFWNEDLNGVTADPQCDIALHSCVYKNQNTCSEGDQCGNDGNCIPKCDPFDGSAIVGDCNCGGTVLPTNTYHCNLGWATTSLACPTGVTGSTCSCKIEGGADNLCEDSDTCYNGECRSACADNVELTDPCFCDATDVSTGYCHDNSFHSDYSRCSEGVTETPCTCSDGTDCAVGDICSDGKCHCMNCDCHYDIISLTGCENCWSNGDYTVGCLPGQMCSSTTSSCIDECSTTDTNITEVCICRDEEIWSSKTVEIILDRFDATYDSITYDLCSGSTASVTWKGTHNIQEVTAEGYFAYDKAPNAERDGYRIGGEIIGHHNYGHSQNIDGLGADVNEPRYFVCTSTPVRFSTQCPTTCYGTCTLDTMTDQTCLCESETCHQFETCSGTQCTPPPTCSDGVEISQPCSCNGVYIQTGFCHSGIISEYDVCSEEYVEPTTLSVDIAVSTPYHGTNSRVQWGIRNKATGADLASGIAGETETITLNYGNEYEAYGTEIPSSYESLGSTVYTYDGWSNSKLTVKNGDDQIISFSGPAYGNNGVEATETFTVALPTPPPFISPPCFCDSSCPHPDCSGLNSPETNCLCGQTVIVDGYCHGSFSSVDPICPSGILTSDVIPCICAEGVNCETDKECQGDTCTYPDCSTDGTTLVSKCICGTEVIENQEYYCHGTYSSDYPLCTDNQNIIPTCLCNGDEISSGYCHGTYFSDYQNCDGDTRPCSCTKSLECATDEVCNGVICELKTCANNKNIISRCSCNGVEISNGYCHGTYSSDYVLCTDNLEITYTCSCHGEDKENGWCYTEGYSQYGPCTLDEEITSTCFCHGHDREVGQCNTDGYSYDYLFTFKTSGAPDPSKSLTIEECDTFGLNSESYPRPSHGTYDATGAKPAGCLLRSQFGLPYYRPDDSSASGDCSEDWQCIEWIETPIRPCANNQNITSTCKCNGVEISSGYCHETYSSDKPNCNGDTRPCSCSSGNDCVTGEVCNDGTCEIPLVDRIELITENLPDLTESLTQSECQDVYDNIYNEGNSMTIWSNEYTPYGCQLDSNSYVYFNTKYMSPTECSSSQSCIKWKTEHVPISDCDTGYNARECTCNGASCSAGKVCDGTCGDPYDALFTFKTSGVSDPTKMLTADECDTFGLNSVFYPRDTVTAEEGQSNTKPHGCLVRPAWLRPYYSSGGTPDVCSEEWQCIEWIDPPVADVCSNTDGSVAVLRKCTCGTSVAEVGQYCHGTYSSDIPNCVGDTRPCSCTEILDCQTDEVCNGGQCEVTFDSYFTFRNDGAPDPSKSLTEDECEAFAQNSESAYSTTMYPAGGGKPAGCMIGGTGTAYVRYQATSNDDCSEAYNCVEWIDPDNKPIIPCANNQVIQTACSCNGEEISSGYCHGTYSSDKPNCDGDTRPCTCTEDLDCQTDEVCNGGQCAVPACANNQNITSTCNCNGEEISSGYCHGTYYSDKQNCDGATRPCSCTKVLDCSSGEACGSGTCEVTFEVSYNIRNSGKYDSSKMLTFEECETFANNSELAADTGVYSAGGGKPAGCMIGSSGWVRWQIEEKGDCSESYNCIEWIDPPIDDCGTGVIFRGCTCGSVTCGHGSTCEQEVCIVPLIDKIEVRTENAVDMTRALTEGECQDVFDLGELSSYNRIFTGSYDTSPYGCILRTNGVIYYNSYVSNIDCSTDYDCIEWKAGLVPVNECGTGLIHRECTCDGASCSPGKVCDGTCGDPYDALFTFKTSGASDPSKMLTPDECDTFAEKSTKAYSTSVYSAGGGKPAGCMIGGTGTAYVRYQATSNDDCSEAYNCVEWIDPPIDDCGTGVIVRGCTCGSVTCGHGGTCEEEVCIVPLIDKIEVRTENAVDMTRALTEGECQDVFDLGELSSYNRIFTGSYDTSPYGCILRTNGVIYYNSYVSNIDCSTDYDCIEWKAGLVPVNECGTGLIHRECTCDGASCSPGKVCDGTCGDPYDALFTFKTSGASDPSKMLTPDECDTFAEKSTKAYSTSVYSAGGGKPAGCMIGGTGTAYVRYQATSNDDCSESYNCVEWIDPPVADVCSNTDWSVAVLRKCTCGTSVAEAGHYCDGTVAKDHSKYNIRSSGASDLIKVLTQDECTVFSTTAAVRGDEDEDMLVMQWDNRPRGCYMRRDHPYMYYNDVLSTSGDPCGSGDTYSTMDCIEWVDPPVEQCIDSSFNLRACVCAPTKAVAVTYDSQTYDICNGDTATVAWNGLHNIQEVTEDGYTKYATATAAEKLSYHIGEAIHGFENNGHSEVIDGLQALGFRLGQTRYFICTTHPASKFSVQCNAGCLSGMDCNGGVCTYPECTNTDGTELMAACQCNGEIENKYCYGTYSSDNPSCTGNIRPCSCTRTLDCQTDEYCTAGTCTSQITQTITLSSGWNWLSIGVTPSDNDRDVLFPNLEHMDKIISRDDGNAIYYDFGGGSIMWDGRLTDIPPYQLLQIKLGNEQTITFSGIPVKDITIPTGWSSFGLPVGDDIAIEDFGAILGLEHMDKIIARDDGNAIYYDFGGGITMWDGRLGTIKPGQGYLIKKTTAGTYTVR